MSTKKQQREIQALEAQSAEAVPWSFTVESSVKVDGRTECTAHLGALNCEMDQFFEMAKPAFQLRDYVFVMERMTAAGRANFQRLHPSIPLPSNDWLLCGFQGKRRASFVFITDGPEMREDFFHWIMTMVWPILYPGMLKLEGEEGEIDLKWEPIEDVKEREEAQGRVDSLIGKQ